MPVVLSNQPSFYYILTCSTSQSILSCQTLQPTPLQMSNNPSSNQAAQTVTVKSNLDLSDICSLHNTHSVSNLDNNQNIGSYGVEIEKRIPLNYL